jgi:hypothetical protein
MDSLSSKYDWFTPTEKGGRTLLETFESFIQHLQEQIPKQLGVNENTNRFANCYLDDLEIVLEKNDFANKIIGPTNSSKERTYPLLTFHSTQSTTKVQSILKHGYLLPGGTCCLYYCQTFLFHFLLCRISFL